MHSSHLERRGFRGYTDTRNGIQTNKTAGGKEHTRANAGSEALNHTFTCETRRREGKRKRARRAQRRRRKTYERKSREFKWQTKRTYADTHRHGHTRAHTHKHTRERDAIKRQSKRPHTRQYTDTHVLSVSRRTSSPHTPSSTLPFSLARTLLDGGERRGGARFGSPTAQLGRGTERSERRVAGKRCRDATTAQERNEHTRAQNAKRKKARETKNEGERCTDGESALKGGHRAEGTGRCHAIQRRHTHTHVHTSPHEKRKQRGEGCFRSCLWQFAVVVVVFLFLNARAGQARVLHSTPLAECHHATRPPSTLHVPPLLSSFLLLP